MGFSAETGCWNKTVLILVTNTDSDVLSWIKSWDYDNYVLLLLLAPLFPNWWTNAWLEMCFMFSIEFFLCIAKVIWRLKALTIAFFELSLNPCLYFLMDIKEVWVTLTPIPLTSVKLHFQALFFLFSSMLCNIWYLFFFLVYVIPFPFKASSTR